MYNVGPLLLAAVESRSVYYFANITRCRDSRRGMTTLVQLFLCIVGDRLEAILSVCARHDLKFVRHVLPRLDE